MVKSRLTANSAASRRVFYRENLPDPRTELYAKVIFVLVSTRPKVLIVSSDRRHTHELAEWARRHGCAVYTEENGAAGLLAAHRERPALVFLAARMPVMDGLQTLRVLRADPAVHEVAVIFLTATGSMEEVARAAEAGADLCLPRESAVEDFQLALTRFLPSQLHAEPGPASQRPAHLVRQPAG